MKRIEAHLATGNGDHRVGTLEYDDLRGKEVSSFELCESFLADPPMRFMGPDIGLFHGKQYPSLPFGFGMFQDAAPDSWGRKLIRRREKRGNLRESDYLLGVFDLTRLGALRFRPEGLSFRFSSPTRTTICAITDSFLKAAVGDCHPPTI